MKSALAVLLYLAVGLWTAAADAEPALMLLHGGDIPPPLQERLKRFGENGLEVPLRWREVTSLEAKPLADHLAEAEKLRAAGEPVVLLFAPSTDTMHYALDREKHSAVINLTALASEDEELYAKRLERMLSRLAAFAMGVNPVPDPFCATRDYRNMADFDRMSRELTPPQRPVFVKKAEALGIPHKAPQVPAPPRPTPPMPQ